MSRPIYLASILLGLALAGGCAQKLQATNLTQLQVGKTSGAEIRKAFGKPDDESNLTDSGGKTQVLRFQHVGGTAVFIWRSIDARMLITETHNDLLRAYIFAGSSGKNATKIDAEAAKKIIVGQTRREEMVALLGEPAGKARPGTRIEDFDDLFTAGVAEVWAWTNVKGLSGVAWEKVKPSTLFVKFDASGRVLGTASDQSTINPLTGSTTRDRNLTK